MAKLFAIAKREYLERVRTKWFIVATLLGPIMLAVITILPAYLAMRSMGSSNVSNIAVLDASGTDLGRRVSGSLVGGPMGDTASALVRIVAPSELAQAESLATSQVMAKDNLQGYLVIDSSTTKGVAARYAGRNASTIPDMERIEGAVRQGLLAMRLQGAGLDPEQVKQLSKVNIKLSTERITDKGRGGSGQGNVIFAFAIAFLLYMSIILYGQTILRGVVEEKTTRVAEVVVASVSPDKLLAGKVLGVGAVGLTQQVVWVVSSVLLLRMRGPIMAQLGLPNVNVPLPDVGIGTGVLLILFFVLGFTFYASLFAAVGAMVNNDQDAAQASTPVTLLLVFSAIFIQPVLLDPTSQLSKVMSWLPFSAPVLMPVRMSLISVSWLEIAAVLAGMVVACAGAVWLAARIYRVGILMYGKKPSLAELGRWIRYAR